MPKQKILLKGISASPGRVSGRVKIVSDPRGIKGASRNEILVMSFLTPDFLSVIKKYSNISGIITDKGGFTCHAAIVTRELKIPYIAGTFSATKRLKNNAEIIIDGKKGIIYGIS